MVIEKLRDLIQRVEIVEHRVADTGALHFYRDLATVAQTSLVDLSEGCRGHGRYVEIRKSFRHSDAELGTDDFFNLVERERLDLVLKAGEGIEVRLWHQLDASGEQLTQLHKRGTEFLQVVGELVRFCRFLRRDPLLGCQGPLEPTLFHQIRAAVFDEEPRNLAIAVQVLRFKRDSHASLKRFSGAQWPWPMTVRVGTPAAASAGPPWQRNRRTAQPAVPTAPRDNTATLGRLLVARLIVGLEPIEESRLLRLELVNRHLLDEPVALFGIVVRVRFLNFITPRFHFFRRFFIAVVIEPFCHFLIARALLHRCLEIVALHALEPKEHVIERTIEMIFADVSPEKRAAVVISSRQNRVAPDSRPRTARRFLR